VTVTRAPWPGHGLRRAAATLGLLTAVACGPGSNRAPSTSAKPSAAGDPRTVLTGLVDDASRVVASGDATRVATVRPAVREECSAPGTTYAWKYETKVAVGAAGVDAAVARLRAHWTTQGYEVHDEGHFLQAGPPGYSMTAAYRVTGESGIRVAGSSRCVP